MKIMSSEWGTVDVLRMEAMIRDGERLRILSEYIQSTTFFDKELMEIILGIKKVETKQTAGDLNDR